MTRRALGADGTMLEAAWQDAVVGWARAYGWRRIFHAPHGGSAAARRGGASRVALGQLPEGRGFPDLVLLRGPRLVIAELKRDGGRMGPGQEEWLTAWHEFGQAIGHVVWRLQEVRDIDEVDPPQVHVAVWRPRDEREVHRVLAAGGPMIPPSPFA